MVKKVAKTKVPPKNSHIRWLVLAACTLLVVLGVFLYLNNRDNKNAPPSNQPQAATDAEKKQSLIESGKGQNPTPPPPASSLSSITDLSARQETNGTVTVLTRLTNSTTGNCQLTVTNGKKSTTKTAAIIYQSEFSTCAGFSVPISELDSGLWQVSLSVGTDNKTTTLEVNP
jgi:hypothetical protein